MNIAIDTVLEKRQMHIYHLLLLGARIAGKEFVAFEHENILPVIQAYNRKAALEKHTPEFRNKLAKAAYNTVWALQGKADKSLVRDLEILAKQAENSL